MCSRLRPGEADRAGSSAWRVRTDQAERNWPVSDEIRNFRCFVAVRVVPVPWASGAEDTHRAATKMKALRWPTGHRHGVLELDGHAGIHRLFGTAVVARALEQAAGAAIVVQPELILPIAVRNPEIDEVGIFRPPERVAGIEGQANGFGIQCRHGRRTHYWILFIAFWTLPGCAAADRPESHGLRQEAEIHVVVGLYRPCRIEAPFTVDETGCARRGVRNAGRKKVALRKRVSARKLPISQRRNVEIPLVGQ